MIFGKMSPFSAICFGAAILLVVYGDVIDAGRVARSPQFGGGFSQAQANAQAGGFGFNRPQYQPQYQPGFGQSGQQGFGGNNRPGFAQGSLRPGFGQSGFGQSGFGQGGFGQGGSISISKSISIGRGGGSQSSAQSSAAGK